MIYKVKTALRITTDAYNDEIQTLITAAGAELSANGVDICNTEFDELITVAVINYCKAYFGKDPNTERYLKAYDNIKLYLMLVCRRKND